MRRAGQPLALFEPAHWTVFQPRKVAVALALLDERHAVNLAGCRGGIVNGGIRRCTRLVINELNRKAQAAETSGVQRRPA
jgi:hypothetical protein